MEHRDAPPATALKYARAERERRFLLVQAPDGPCVRRAAITDLYVAGTRLRLRRAVETTTSGSTITRKFTQKIPAPGGGPGLITTMYLNEAEHAVLSALPGSGLTKTRYSLPPFAVDVFTGILAGLLMAEIEFESAEEEKRFQVPPGVIAEVTTDPRFSGGRLALTKPNELVLLLAEFGLEPHDASELAARTLAAPR
jgi:CYTH domain-containing protein